MDVLNGLEVVTLVENTLTDLMGLVATQEDNYGSVEDLVVIFVRFFVVFSSFSSSRFFMFSNQSLLVQYPH